MQPANNPQPGAAQPATVQPEKPDLDGVLDGGWTYIWAAYGVTWTFLVGYALSLAVRRLLQRGSA
jgi:hypothetical protein